MPAISAASSGKVHDPRHGSSVPVESASNARGARSDGAAVAAGSHVRAAPVRGSASAAGSPRSVGARGTTPINQTPPEGPCMAPGRCSGFGILWNARGERACGFHQNWLARPRKDRAVAA